MKKKLLLKTMIVRCLLGCLAAVATCGMTAVASAQTRTLRIVTYNIEADSYYGTTALAGLICPFSGTGTFTTSCSGSVTNGGVLEGIGEEIVNGDPAQPIDVLALQETTSNGTTVQPILDGLNAFCFSNNIAAGYAMSTYQATQNGGNGSGNGPNAMVYNTNTVQLVASVGVGTPQGSGNGEYRQVVRYEFAPAGVTPTTNNEFYVYVSHYKSGTGPNNDTYRNEEAQIIRADSATLPSNARILYVGDYNINGSSDACYQTIVASGTNAGVDPLNPSGVTGIDWTANSLLNQKTDSSRSLHYRDDLEVMTSNVYYGVAGGLAYVPGTYHTFGNNGSVARYSSIISGNTALDNDLESSPPISAAQCYTNLYGGSDHLPVVADYTIPTGGGCTPPATPTASNNGPICAGGTLTLSTPTVTGATYSWTGPNSFSSTQQNPSITSATPAASGTYSVTVTTNGCPSAAGTTTATVNAIPATPTASNNGPICAGGTLTLSTPTVTGATYSWAGPNSFSSTQQNPSIAPATMAASGTYYVTVTVNGCASAAGSTTATVNPVPAAPTAGNNGPILAGNTLNLTASTVDNTTYSWTGPNGFTSTDQNPSIPNATSAASGTYSVTVTDTNGCTSAAGSTTALVMAPQITSISAEGSDIRITWATTGGTTNAVEATNGDPGYNTNFVNISGSLFILGSGVTSTNYVDVGGVTNSPNRFYRVRLVP